MKSKRKVALAVIMALIVSMLPMTVFAGSTMKDGAAKILSSKGTESTKIGMYATVSDVKLTEAVDGKANVEFTIQNGKTSKTNLDTELYGIYFGTKAEATAANDADIIKVVDGKINLTGIEVGKQYSIAYKYRTKADAENWDDYKWGDGTKITFKYKSEAQAEASKEPSIKNITADAGVVELTPSEGSVYVNIDYEELGKPVEVSFYSGSMKRWIGYQVIINEKATETALEATILRAGNVKKENIGTDYGKSKYSLMGVSGKTVTLKIDGNLTMAYLGTYDKAIEAERTIDISGDDVKVEEDKVAIAANDAEVVAMDANAIGKIVEVGAPVQIQNKVGTVLFDSDAVASIFQRQGLGGVNFEMKDLKETAEFADTDYDLVLDLSLKDADGNALFAEGDAKGGATITVPYTKEVPEGKTVKVFYITASGREEVEATYDADAKTVSFKVAHFSQYGIEQADADVTKSPNTGDNTLVLLFVGLMMLCSAAFVATKKGLIK